MLRYKVYQIVTHQHFPYYAFIASIFLYIGSFYILANPPLLNITSFISENAVSPSVQLTRIDSIVSSVTFRDFSQYSNSSIYYFYHKNPRTPKKDCISLLFNYNPGKIGLQLALSTKKYIESQGWAGDILFVLYKKNKWALEFREFHQWSLGKFGVIRCFFDWDIDERYSYLTIDPYGLNGVQTDLDQVQATLTLIRKVNIDFKFPIPSKTSLGKLQYTLSSFNNILFPDLDSPHSYLITQGYVAIKLFTVAYAQASLISTLSMCKVIELVIRTFTALDENLHAGYYFYFFTSPTHIMPLSKYAFVVGALISPLLFQAILILKQEWFDPAGVYNLILPYLACFLIYISSICSTFPAYLKILPLVLVLFAQKSGKVFKAYSNLALGTSIVVMSIWNFPLSLAVSLIVPIKVLLPAHRTQIGYFFTLGICVAGILALPLGEILEVEVNCGHCLYFWTVCGVAPCLVHIAYLFR